MSNHAKALTTTPPLPVADRSIPKFRTPPRISRFSPALRPAEVFARFDTADSSPNDIYNALTITMENGALVSLASTGATPLAERNYEVRIFGSKAILQLELWRGTMSLIDFADHRTRFKQLTENEIYPGRAPALNFLGRDSGPSAEWFARRFGPGRHGDHCSRLRIRADESLRKNSRRN